MQNLVQFRMTDVRQRISPECMKIFKIGLGHFIPQFLPHWLKKLWWTLVH